MPAPFRPKTDTPAQTKYKEQIAQEFTPEIEFPLAFGEPA
jgi:hypothetical protein